MPANRTNYCCCCRLGPAPDSETLPGEVLETFPLWDERGFMPIDRKPLPVSGIVFQLIQSIFRLPTATASAFRDRTTQFHAYSVTTGRPPLLGEVEPQP
jgi:hypothetical protein